MSTHYLDWAASAPPYPDILDSAAELAGSVYGNPSSRHAAGRNARKELESARATLAAAIGTTSERVIFTSGGTEADSMVLLSTLVGKGHRSIVVSAIEHAAIFEQARLLEDFGLTVIRVRPDNDGIVQPDVIADAIRPDTVMVAVMAVNNETGAIQPMAAIAAAARSAPGGSGRVPFVHCDAVQALGKIPFDPESLGIDGAAFSAHKLGGPRGVGALYLRRPVNALAMGGGQEYGLRPGTHNTAGAWALSKAVHRSVESLSASYALASTLENELLEGILSIRGATIIPETRCHRDARYSPFIVCVAFPGLGGETMARLLDDSGIYVSTGSACSGPGKERRVLDAMGVDRDLAFSTIRVSTGRETTSSDIEAFLERAASMYSRYKI